MTTVKSRFHLKRTQPRNRKSAVVPKPSQSPRRKSNASCCHRRAIFLSIIRPILVFLTRCCRAGMPRLVSHRDEVSRRSEDQPQCIGWNLPPDTARGIPAEEFWLWLLHTPIVVRTGRLVVESQFGLHGDRVAAGRIVMFRAVDTTRDRARIHLLCGVRTQDRQPCCVRIDGAGR